MKHLRKPLLVGALVLLGVFVAEARETPPDKLPGCAQWEVMLAPSVRSASDSKPLPELGTSVEQAPAGWEPFAFNPSGQLVYRRCAR